MKFLITIALTTVALIMAGCTANEETEAVSVPLSFSASVYAQTRAATELTTDNLASAGVFAFFTQGDFNASTAAPNFMYNQKLEKSGGAWTYSPERYWPNNENDKISFFAYAPYNIPEVTISDKIKKGYPVLNYENMSCETDFLVAAPLMNQTKSNGTLQFKMKHQLTKVSIYVKNGDVSPGEKKITKLRLDGIRKKGTLTFNSTGCSWGFSTDVEYKEQTGNLATISGNTQKDEKVRLITYYLLPEAADITLSIAYSMYGSVESGDPPVEEQTVTDIKLPADAVWAAGEARSYMLIVKKTGVEIAEISDVEWSENDVQDIRMFESTDLKLGDYYYSDGTTSDGGLRVMVNGVAQEYTGETPDGSKTVVGVVFYVGRHPEDNGVYVDKNGNSMEVHGYVINKSETTDQYYNGPTSLIGTYLSQTDFNGYFNTQKMQGHTGYNNLMSYINGLAGAPGTTSGWFLPSIGQLVYLKSNYKQGIHKNLQKCGSIMGSGWQKLYWSSSEATAATAFCITDWNTGGIGTKNKWQGAQTRAALVF